MGLWVPFDGVLLTSHQLFQPSILTPTKEPLSVSAHKSSSEEEENKEQQIKYICFSPQV